MIVSNYDVKIELIDIIIAIAIGKHNFYLIH